MSKQEKLTRFKIVSKLIKEGKTVDLGAGLPNPYLKNVIGVDLHFDNYYNFDDKHYTYLKMNLNKRLSFKNNSFDNVIGGSIIEHLENPYNFLKECYRICKPKGKIIIVTDNVFYYNRYIWYYKKQYNPHHLIEITHNSMKQLFRKTGFKYIKQRGDFLVIPYIRNILKLKNPYITKSYITIGSKR